MLNIASPLFARFRALNYLVPAAVATIYGVLSYCVFRYGFDGGLLTGSFLAGSPLVLGYLSHPYQEGPKAPRFLWPFVAIPIVVVGGLLGLAQISGLEGLICLVIIAVPFFGLCITGYLFAYGVQYYLYYARKKQDEANRGDDSKKYGSMSAIVLLLPFIAFPVENQIGASLERYRVDTEIIVNAPPAKVWNSITRYKLISADEMPSSIAIAMGFPRPLYAELDTVAVGGVRIATFERGLFFKETVNELKRERLMRFSIEADPTSIPPTALDEHVLIGGKYFDVLEGCYELEPLPDGGTRLKLYSYFQFTTTLNFYASFWGRLVMEDIQDNILLITKNRCEKKGA